MPRISIFRKRAVRIHRLIALILFNVFEERKIVQHHKLDGKEETNYFDVRYLSDLLNTISWATITENNRYEVKPKRKKLFRCILFPSVMKFTLDEWIFRINKSLIGIECNYQWICKNKKYFIPTMDKITINKINFYKALYPDNFNKIFNDFREIPGNSKNLLNGFGFLKSKEFEEIKYPMGTIFINRKYVRVYSAVYRIFIGDIPAGLTIDHKNIIHSDNCYLNLRTMSISENNLNKRNSLNQYYYVLDMKLNLVKTSSKLSDILRDERGIRRKTMSLFGASQSHPQIIFCKEYLLNYLSKSKHRGNIYLKLDKNFNIIETSTKKFLIGKLNTDSVVNGYLYYTLDFYWRMFPEQMKKFLREEDWSQIIKEMKEKELFVTRNKEVNVLNI